MIRRTALIAGTLTLVSGLARGFAQETRTDPHSSPHRHEAMEHRGDDGMGFSQAKTTHHFLLKPEGGVIAVSANDAADSESRDQIRTHLAHIASAFGEGNFDIPMFVHDETPPGVPVMIARRDRIQYRFEPRENGGQVVITTRDPEALSAVHEFLRFQIREHATGDPTTVK